MGNKTHKQPTENSVTGEGGDTNANVKDALGSVVGIIAGQVKILQAKATDGALDIEQARLLGMYARALVSISNDERHAAAIIMGDLGKVDNEDLDAQVEEAKRVLGKK
jgi:hypothetical protein